jgi:phospholipid/cholesterol/gamma-HCH transport system ATP-binding protein
MSAEPVIELHDVVVRYGQRAVLDGCSLRVDRGESVTLIGPTGGGKSTVLKLLLGFVKPAAGKVRLLGLDPVHASEAELYHIRNRLGIVFQRGGLFSAGTVAENIAFPVRELHAVPERVVHALVRLKARSVGLAEADLEKRPAELSGGTLKRVALARSLALDPELLLFDEPTAGLDPIAARKFVELAAALRAEESFSLLTITHDIGIVRALADRVAVLYGGKIIALDTLPRVRAMDHPFIREYFAAENAA